MDSEILKSWKFWVALGAGFIAGATAGLLYAPMEGAELRKKTGELATNVAQSATNTANKVAAAAQSSVTVYGTVARNAGSQIERLFKSVAAGVDEANRVRDDFKQKAEEVKNAE
jgi:gas vesicle protein